MSNESYIRENLYIYHSSCVGSAGEFCSCSVFPDETDWWDSLSWVDAGYKRSTYENLWKTNLRDGVLPLLANSWTESPLVIRWLFDLVFIKFFFGEGTLILLLVSSTLLISWFDLPLHTLICSGTFVCWILWSCIGGLCGVTSWSLFNCPTQFSS